ncbi:response regulator [Marinobacterium rhizophilum]|uniref:response regulator n=1 Tax=Marinobacterium rhizophilum TaxID=420402 RepID=UPI000368CCF3|nr:response regulator [Marinobacterium rhizophilum]
MNANKTILVVADDVDDADIVSNLLSKEFDQVFISTDPDKAVEDFEQYSPAVLVLAFASLARAQTYYLGLYRLSAQAHAHPHKTLILCSKDELQQVYSLCKKGHFSSYVLFWPLGYDSTRLGMEVHHALRQLALGEAEIPTASELAFQARRIAGLESLLKASLMQGAESIASGKQALDQSGEDIRLALEGFASRFSSEGQQQLREAGGAAGASVLEMLQAEFTRVQTEHVDKHLDTASRAMEPVSDWAQRFRQELEPQLESVRELQALTETRKPLVLVVDDDEFQHKLVARLLQESGAELIFALNSMDALAVIRSRRPELIFMDIDLPDLSGIETTRRIKAIEAFASIPVVMITGHSKRDVVVESLKAGACDFVVKPFDKTTLLKKFRSLVRSG